MEEGDILLKCDSPTKKRKGTRRFVKLTPLIETRFTGDNSETSNNRIVFAIHVDLFAIAI